MALRILTQVNYSAGENPDGDSGLRFTAGLLLSLVNLDSDLHFYVLIPAKHEGIWANALAHPRITTVPLDLEPRLHGGDFQFNPRQLYERFDFRRYDVDLLFVNQPETATALLHFFNRQTFHNIPAVSYVHWFDTRRPSTPKQKWHYPALLGALSGMMLSATTGCNSAFGRGRILEEAGRWFHEDAIRSLSERIRILPPGVDVSEIEANRVPRREGGPYQILVNHRILKYTGVRSLLTDVFPKLWSHRQDFNVLVTNPSHVRLPGLITKAPWLTMQTLTRPQYLRCLWECDVVVGPHRASHWSMSTLEAICANCIPLMNKESFFAEMLSPLISELSLGEREHVESRWFYFRGSIVSQLSQLLDNLSEERSIVKRVAAQARATYSWASLAPIWDQVFRDTEREIPMMASNNPSMCKIIKLLHEQGRVSKAEILNGLRWAPKQRALSWTAFRKRLKSIAYEDPLNPEAVFQLLRNQDRDSLQGLNANPNSTPGQLAMWDFG